MNKQNKTIELIEKIAKLSEEDLTNLIDTIDKLKKKDDRRWRVERGKEYWTITSCGAIAQRMADGEYVYDCFEMGNAFRTLKEAEFEVEKRKVKAELERYALEHNDQDFKEWNEGNLHYAITCSKESDDLAVDFAITLQNESVTYFTSIETARDAIKAVGEERIKKYIFGVEVENE